MAHKSNAPVKIDNVTITKNASLELQAVGSIPVYSVGSDVTVLNASTERNTNATTDTKIKEVTFNHAGNVFVSWEQKAQSATGYVTLYKNGSAVSSIYADTTLSYVLKTYANIAVAIGDKIQLYGKADPGHQVFVRNFTFKRAYRTGETPEIENL